MTDEIEQPGKPCARCRELEEQVERLAWERQHLLEQLAEEKSRANALYLAFPPQGDGDAAAPPPLAGAVPLRYQVADAVNKTVKKLLPGAHVALRKRIRGGP